jgi:hypothetical protein
MHNGTAQSSCVPHHAIEPVPCLIALEINNDQLRGTPTLHGMFTHGLLY